MTEAVFLFDVDNTLLDNDAVIDDLRRQLVSAFGTECEQRYWDIFEELRRELGYADYLGALQRYRIERPRDPHLLGISLYLLHYPFADRVYPGAFEIIRHLAGRGSLRRRCRLSATKGRAVGTVGRGCGRRAHLHPQGADARRRRAALSSAPVCDG